MSVYISFVTVSALEFVLSKSSTGSSQVGQRGWAGQGLVLAGSRADFAGNIIVLITAVHGRVRITSFNDLKKMEVQRIALGNPATVPAGMYAYETLKSLGLRDDLGPKLVFGEHVRQVVDYVVRDEVDAGMVFLTDAISGRKGLKIAAEAPASSHKPVVYTAAVIKGAKNEALARDFVSLVTSADGKAVLRKDGFRTEQ